MKFRMLVTVLCLSVFLAITPWGTTVAIGKDLTKITLLMPGPSAVSSMCFWAAVGEGYFKDEGLEVKWEAVDGSSQVLQGLVAGQAQIGRPGPGPLLAARERGVDIVSFYNQYPKSQFAMVVKEKSSYQTPRDLKGKVIGIGTADGGEAGFARSILAGSDMEEGKDYTFLPVGDGGTAAAAFLRDDIEAYSASMFDAATISLRGVPLREITPVEFLSYFGSPFMASNAYIKEHPDVIKGFGRALVRGMRFSLNKANKEKVLEYCKPGNPQEAEQKDLVSALYDKVLDRMTPVDTSLPWGYQPLSGWLKWQESMLASGVLKKPMPNLEAVFTNEFIEYFNGK